MSETTSIPKRQHENCDNYECKVCLADHSALAEYFQYRLKNAKEDWLMQYRRWLDANEIPAETNGWASKEAFAKENVDAFIDHWIGNE